MYSLKKLFAYIFFCSPNQQSYLQELPNEIFLEIVIYLKFKDLQSVACLDKYYNNLMKTGGFSYFIQSNKKKSIRRLNIAAQISDHFNDYVVLEGMVKYFKQIPSFDANLEYALVLALKENQHNAALLLINHDVNVNTRFHYCSDALSVAIHNLRMAELEKSTINDVTRNQHQVVIAALIDKGAIIERYHIQNAALQPSKFVLDKMAEKVGSEKVSSTIAKLPKMTIVD